MQFIVYIVCRPMCLYLLFILNEKEGEKELINLSYLAPTEIKKKIFNILEDIKKIL